MTLLAKMAKRECRSSANPYRLNHWRMIAAVGFPLSALLVWTLFGDSNYFLLYDMFIV